MATVASASRRCGGGWNQGCSSTHWHLADGSDVEILNYLDDHSRLLLASDAFSTTKAADVVGTFHAAAEHHGYPASLLTDNGAVFTGASRKGKVLLESELERLGIVAKHSTPYHPQTCGKVERFHQSRKRFLVKQAPAHSLQLQLDTFRAYYNQQRPHRALGGRTPLVAFNARLKARPEGSPPATHFRVRKDRTDLKGTVTLRYLSRLRHILSAPLTGTSRSPSWSPAATSASSPRTAHCSANSPSIRPATTSPSADHQARLDSATMT